MKIIPQVQIMQKVITDEPIDMGFSGSYSNFTRVLHDDNSHVWHRGHQDQVRESSVVPKSIAEELEKQYNIAKYK